MLEFYPGCYCDHQKYIHWYSKECICLHYEDKVDSKHIAFSPSLSFLSYHKRLKKKSQGTNCCICVFLLYILKLRKHHRFSAWDPLNPRWDGQNPKFYWSPSLHIPFLSLADHSDFQLFLELVSLQFQFPDSLKVSFSPKNVGRNINNIKYLLVLYIPFFQWACFWWKWGSCCIARKITSWGLPGRMGLCAMVYRWCNIQRVPFLTSQYFSSVHPTTNKF